jgi:hypothetical protein
MAVHELILLLCEIARDKWCSYWEHDPDARAEGPLQLSRDPARFQTSKVGASPIARAVFYALSPVASRLACSQCTDFLPCCAGGEANKLIVCVGTC